MSIRTLAWSVYVPSFLFATGQGAVIPILALLSTHLGATPAVAGLVVALSTLGILLFDLSSGWLISRFGEGTSIAVGSIVLVAGLIASALAHSVAQLAVATIVVGCGWSVWVLARLSYVGDVVPVSFRGRALSTLG